MADVFGQAFWPGAASFLDAEYTCSWGITPGRATLTIPPQLDRVAEVGDLTFTDGTNRLVLRDCKVVKPAGGVGPEGQRVILLIEDHRWRWEFGAVSGRYNILAERTSTVPPVVNPDKPPPLPPPGPPPAPVKGEEPIYPWSRKTAPELARLCLKAMGERNYDVSALDPTATPSVDWDGTNPARALDQLANDLGCVVVYRPDTNSVLVTKRGVGADLPDGSFLDDAPALVVKARPSRLVCVGARTHVQQRWPLRAVGLEFDGSYKPLDLLSYTPAGGWELGWPPHFDNVPDDDDLPGARTHEDAVALAARSVYRCYQVDVRLTNLQPLTAPPGQGPGHVTIKRLEQLRLLPVRNLAVTDDLGRESRAAATCYGRYAPEELVKIGGSWDKAYEDTTDTTEVRVPCSIDDRHSVVIFEDYVFGVEGGQVIRPKLVLECAAEVADPDTMQFVRYRRGRPLGSAGLPTKPAYFLTDDVRYLVTAIYDPDGGQLLRTETNAKDVERRADYYIAGELRRYEPAEAGDRTYPGVLPIMPDGAVMQVTWRVGGGSESNPQTRASRNTEHATYLPTYEGRRRIEQTNPDAKDREKVQNRLQRLFDILVATGN